ncbi:hypothetical protein EOD41_14990 [Mucilaginibacter limnophilus]|uniref:FimB/Mfa2 family fimbrial subunit n=1 Tax=Mucilaginibacter limnophilus TaxID=1932778 RepID=A0A437MQ23_9SPHI|nr:FimB/Mfa2 family fimbrial subunit [Mucilaginibacter limnophilus]RVT99748.1 hypothetical protein EOD41_14990 [Mucilaginibacter limnophilus]
MKIFLCISIILFVVLSCKKSQSIKDEENGKKYQVSFDVRDFTQKETDFDNTSTSQLTTHNTPEAIPIEDVISILYCVVYSNDGKPAMTIQQLSSQANFGNLNLNLPNGNYTVVFVGGQSGLIYKPKRLSEDKISYTRSTGADSFSDTFYKKFALVIDGANNNSSIILERLVGRVRVVIEDALPLDIKSITIRQTTNIYDGVQIATGIPLTLSTDLYAGTTVQLPTSSVGLTGYSLSFVTLNTLKSFNVEIAVKKGSSYYQNTTLVRDVTVGANKTTVLTGKLFESESASPGNGFLIDINQAWDPEDLDIPF